LIAHWQSRLEHGSGGVFRPMRPRHRVTASEGSHPSSMFCATCVADLSEGTVVARADRHVTVSGKPLQPTCFSSGDDTAGRRCGNSARRSPAPICGSWLASSGARCVGRRSRDSRLAPQASRSKKDHNHHAALGTSPQPCAACSANPAAGRWDCRSRRSAKVASDRD
jgi:hypothetical protein